MIIDGFEVDLISVTQLRCIDLYECSSYKPSDIIDLYIIFKTTSRRAKAISRRVEQNIKLKIKDVIYKGTILEVNSDELENTLLFRRRHGT